MSKEEKKIDNIYMLLAKSQSEFGDIKKSAVATVITKEGGKYNYNYATLDDIINETQETLMNNNLVCFFREEVCDNHKSILLCTIQHTESDQKIESSVIVDNFYDSKSKMSTIQQKGSIDTYLRRYLMSKMLNIPLMEDDDARGIGQGGDRKASEGQIKYLRGLLEQRNISEEKYCDSYKLEKLEDITMSVCSESIKKNKEALGLN